MISSWDMDADRWWNRYCLQAWREWTLERVEIRLYWLCPVVSTGYLPKGIYMPGKRALLFLNLMVVW